MIGGACTSRALHLDVREQRIPPKMTVEIYFSHLRDASMYGNDATLEKGGIAPQPKPYLRDQRDSVAGFQNIPFPLELWHLVLSWGPTMDEDVSSGYDSEAGLMCRNPSLMWFHIERSEGFLATNPCAAASASPRRNTRRMWTNSLLNLRSSFRLAAIPVMSINSTSSRATLPHARKSRRSSKRWDESILTAQCEGISWDGTASTS